MMVDQIVHLSFGLNNDIFNFINWKEGCIFDIRIKFE